VTDLLPMLEATSAASLLGGADPGMPATPVNADTMRMLMAIEASAWDSPQAARRASLAALAERDRARENRQVPIRPTAMSAAELATTINRLSGRVAA
jgi:intracellular multiplication protein IcmO